MERMKRRVRGRQGQAITEYLLLMVTIVAIFLALQKGFQKIGRNLWKQMVCDISAPCVMCRPPASIAESSASPAPCRAQ